MPLTSAHFCRGTVPVAFIFIAPGEIEDAQQHPIAGATGSNFDHALEHLHGADPAMFPSKYRYDYRITNSYSDILSSKRGNGRTEPKVSEVKQAGNLARIKSEIAECATIILCGKRPAALCKLLSAPGLQLVRMPHIGNRSLNHQYSVETEYGICTPTTRRVDRATQWAKQLIQALARADVA